MVRGGLVQPSRIRDSTSKWSMRSPARRCSVSSMRSAGASTGDGRRRSPNLPVPPKAPRAASTSFRTRCARPTPSTVPRRTGFCSATFRPAVPTGPQFARTDVFTCLSHDIVAHETTHAIVDGIREFFTEPTNIDVPAFHEAFADLAALFSHFAHKEALLDTLQKTGGKLFQSQLKPEAATEADRSQARRFRRKSPRRNPLIATGAAVR